MGRQVYSGVRAYGAKYSEIREAQRRYIGRQRRCVGLCVKAEGSAR